MFLNFCFKYSFKNLLVIIAVCFSLAGCKVGEDDPAISFRSRDNRLKANWKMAEMNNRYEIRTFQPGASPVTTVIESVFDGYDARVKITVNGILVSDSTFGMSYLMKIEEDGKLLHETAQIQLGFSIKSSGEDNWYWLNTDKKKARLYVGSALQTPLVAGIPVAPGGANSNLNNLATDFNVDGLRNKELDLSYDKTLNQAALNGSFQQIILHSKLKFTSK
jgi:hypothetical protein